MEVLLFAIVLQVTGGFAALLLARWPRPASWIGAGAAVLGCLLGLAPALRVLIGGPPESLHFGWDATHCAFDVAIDPLTAYFLLPVLGLSALAAVYGGNYMLAFSRTKPLGGAWFFLNVFMAGMTMVLIARTILVFLVAWEVMSIAAFCLVTFEHEKSEVRQAGWVYLIATHLGVMFLFIAFLLLGRQGGSLEFSVFRTMPALGVGWSGLVFVLAVAGFGIKAGFVPFHVWLPEAHSAAPSHVSALMSGVMIKMGLYGILRILTFLGQPAPWFGLMLAVLGLLTAIVGISLAVSQRDMKRVLAYSSIENVGLIALALGVGIWGWASHLPVVAVLGMSAALLHTWNHALMKGLMFFAVGSVLHASGTRDMEKLGGLLKRMPWTGSAMLVGAVALAALPSLNGFASKWLIYMSLMECGLPTSNSGSLVALLAIGLLALIGGLTAFAFVRLTGTVLLGSPRTLIAEQAHESSPWMLAPMCLLVILCLAVAVVPQMAMILMSGPLNQILGSHSGEILLDMEYAKAPLATVGSINALLLIAILGGVALMRTMTRNAARSQGPTWGCGYIKPTARMQYSAQSFSQMLAEQLVFRFLRPRTRRDAPHGLFPGAGKFDAEFPDPVCQKVYEPFFRRWADRFCRLRFLQQGKVHVYLLYMMFMVVLALAWASLRTWLWGAS